MTFLAIAILAYTLGIAAASVVTVYRNRTARNLASALFAAGWTLHLVAILHHALSQGRLPLSNVGEYLLVLGWVVLSLHLYLWFWLRVEVAGLVLPPIACLTAIASFQLLSMEGNVTSARPGWWFLFHTSVSTVGMAILAVAFTMSIIYLIKDRALKMRKTLRLLERLPALEMSDQVGFQALLTGFLLLSLGIGTGVVVNAAVHGRLWVLGAKQIFPLLAWTIFAGVLIGRTVLGFRGRKSAYLTITGFLLGLLTVLGMTL